MSQTLEIGAKPRRIETRSLLDSVFTLSWLLFSLWNWAWLGPIWVAAMRPAPDHFVDFYQDWASARNYWSGYPIYTSHSTSVPLYLGLPSNPSPNIEYNIHPPTSVLLALPLGRFTYSDAALAGNVISLAAFLASLVILAKMLSLPRSLCFLGMALFPFCHPVYANLYQGQVTLILVLLVTGMWALERSGYPGLAATLLAMAATIKLFPAYLVIYYAAQGKIRFLMSFMVSVLALGLITVIVLGPGTYDDYVRIVLPWNAEFRTIAYNISFAGLWHKLFHPVPGERIIPLWPSLALARWATLISNLVVTVLAAKLAWSARTTTQRDMAFALAATAMLLVSPVTWDQSIPILLVPFALMARSPLFARSLWLPAALIIILVIDSTPHLILTKIALAGRQIHEYPWTFMLGAPSLKFYMLLATMGLAALTFWSDTTNQDPVAAAVEADHEFVT